jgi:hypothetical protein
MFVGLLAGWLDPFCVCLLGCLIIAKRMGVRETCWKLKGLGASIPGLSLQDLWRIRSSGTQSSPSVSVLNFPVNIPKTSTSTFLQGLV